MNLLVDAEFAGLSKGLITAWVSADEGFASSVHVEVLLKILAQIKAPLANGATEWLYALVRVTVATERVLGSVGFVTAVDGALVRVLRHLW